MGDATFTFRVDDDLKSAFAEAARAQDRSSAQLLRALMRDAVKQQQEAADYDAWFRAEIEQALREADDPNVERIPHEVVQAKLEKRRAKLIERAAR